MVYDISGIEISGKLLNKYFDGLIGSIFKILPIYEGCVERYDELKCEDAFIEYDTYLQRMIVELAGAYHLIGFEKFMELQAILTGIQYNISKKNNTTLDHTSVKSLVFHCISIVKKMHVKE